MTDHWELLQSFTWMIFSLLSLFVVVRYLVPLDMQSSRIIVLKREDGKTEEIELRGPDEVASPSRIIAKAIEFEKEIGDLLSTIVPQGYQLKGSIKGPDYLVLGNRKVGIEVMTRLPSSTAKLKALIRDNPSLEKLVLISKEAPTNELSDELRKLISSGKLQIIIANDNPHFASDIQLSLM